MMLNSLWTKMAEERALKTLSQRGGHPKLQGLSSVDHKDNFPKEEGAQTRDFHSPSDVELD